MICAKEQRWKLWTNTQLRGPRTHYHGLFRRGRTYRGVIRWLADGSALRVLRNSAELQESMDKRDTSAGPRRLLVAAGHLLLVRQVEVSTFLVRQRSTYTHSHSLLAVHEDQLQPQGKKETWPLGELKNLVAGRSGVGRRRRRGEHIIARRSCQVQVCRM